MAERPKIALIYSYNSDWIAGAYYILNLVYALNKQDDKDKPELIILSYSQEEFDIIAKTHYPYLKFQHLNEKDFWASYNLLERIINKISRIVIKRDVFRKAQTTKRLKVQADLLFPASEHIYFSTIKKKLFWIPDFQEYFLPQFFSEKEITQRKNYQKALVHKSRAIVFSSKNALDHFKQFYPTATSPVFVLPFAVTHPDYKSITMKMLADKYRIHRPYFFCPNQFWAHKNHITVLKAISHLKKNGLKEVLVVFSGKELDQRNPEFIKGIKAYISEHQLEEHVRLLGFIDREDQLQLMNSAISVIQPSLFEGWSTVVEDAKSMSQHVVISSLDVHKEQLKENCTFFDPLNEVELAACLMQLMEKHPVRKEMDYEKSIHAFGNTFTKIVNELIK
jgi:glycosyltransferase involved in cell wall biosynthesis